MRRSVSLLLSAAVLVLAGFTAGRLTASEPALPSTAAVTKAPRPAALPKRSRLRVPDVPSGANLESARAEAAVWEALYEGLLVELYGMPVAFPTDTPESSTPAGAQTAMAEILATCDVPGTMLGLDCTEYPCIARFRADGDTLDAITSCRAWTNRYGLGAGVAQVAADCGAGRKEAVLLLQVDGWQEGWKRLDEDGNVSKRTSARQQEMLAEWPCI